MPERILIIDDSPTIRLTTKNCLLRMGVEADAIRVAASGREALEAFAAFRPDLVFLDLVLPGMNGKRVATQLLKLDPGLRVVLVTGTAAGDPRIAELLSLGVFDVIQKPVHLEKLEMVFSQLARDDRGLHRVQ